MAIKEKVKRKLWAASGGFCAKPDCHADLFPFIDNGTITNIEEFSHIIAQHQRGPRGNSIKKLADRDEFENIVLLCPNCHSVIDKNPSAFSKTMIKEWKSNHESSIRDLFSEHKFTSRTEIRKFLEPLLAENKYIFDHYGPYSENALEFQSETELNWERLVLKIILPNNRRIEKVIEINQHLLKKEESRLFIEFKMHREGFEYNKISGNVNATAPKFPKGFENIFI